MWYQAQALTLHIQVLKTVDHNKGNNMGKSPRSTTLRGLRLWTFKISGLHQSFQKREESWRVGYVPNNLQLLCISGRALLVQWAQEVFAICSISCNYLAIANGQEGHNKHLRQSGVPIIPSPSKQAQLKCHKYTEVSARLQRRQVPMVM